jgi:ketosteroid isomerase-like protein
MDKEVKAVLDAEERRRAALVAVDMSALNALFADDLVHIHSTALVHNKAQILKYIEERRAYIQIHRGPLAVRITDDIAVITGTMVNHMRADGKEYTLSGMVTQVLRREAGAWRFINFQLTRADS